MPLKHSKQRQAIWDFIKDRTDHPTADFVYNHVRREIPGLSLGTVYRNLMLLKDLGMLRAVEVGDGAVHFDPNTCDHDHFICRSCGRVLDLDGNDTGSRMPHTAHSFQGRIDGCSVYFYGLCSSCLKKADAEIRQKS